MEKKAVQKYKKECVHHWEIAPASGGDSQGKCKKCKLVKNFSNSGWDNSKNEWHTKSVKKESTI